MGNFILANYRARTSNGLLYFPPISIIYSSEGFVEGKGLDITYKAPAIRGIESPSFYAVVCGVSSYERGQINLRYAEHDAQSMSKAVQLGATQLFGVEKTHVYTLTSPGKSLPTKVNIKATFEEIAKIARPEDILMLYLSGHGITWGGDMGDFYFLTSDAFSTSQDAYNDPAIRNSTSINTKEFVEWINKIPALKQVMVIDACGSGKAVDNLLASRNVDASQIRSIHRMKDRTGMFVISGCAANAISYEASRFGQGVLTYSILQAMKGAALREDKFVDVNTLLSYARDNVPKMAEGVGGNQTPQLLIPKGGSFDIGLLNENDRAKIRLSSPKLVFVRSLFINIKELEDNLNLSVYLDEQLNNISTKGKESNLMFIDAKQFPGGCKMNGTYQRINNHWTLKGKLKCGTKETAFEILARDEAELKSKLLKWVENIKDH